MELDSGNWMVRDHGQAKFTIDLKFKPCTTNISHDFKGICFCKDENALDEISSNTTKLGGNFFQFEIMCNSRFVTVEFLSYITLF